MDLDPAKADALDRTFRHYAEELELLDDPSAAVTLAYTHSLHSLWRTALRMLPVSAAWSVLDVGCGLGILSFELAANLPLHIDAVDIDPNLVACASELLQRLRAQGLLVEGATVEIAEGDVRALDFPDEHFDLVFVRELLQFLADPAAAVRELYRVLAPGAYLCISDTDDQLRITWPPMAPALERLVAAVAAVQYGRGGDRQTGRKLTTYLRAAGFDLVSVVVLPEAQHRQVTATDHERVLILDQLRAARRHVIEAGAMTAGRFDADLAEVEAAEPFEEFRMNARIIVLGRRPSHSAHA
jgi:ubiquinone/menaquinone biosynthesis C-methylase UbiE